MQGHVLIVDDDADMRAVYRIILSALDVSIELAADGEEALAQIERRLPDVVLLDLMMPDIDGIEMLKRLKDHLDTEHLPVILLSAHDVLPRDLPEFAGLVGVLRKDRLGVAGLRQVVTDVLDGDFENAVSRVAGFANHGP